MDSIAFFKYLASPKFYQDFNREFTRKEVLERIQIIARAIVTAKIYSVYTPRSYQRTNKLLQSFLTATDGDQQNANITLYSSPEIAAAKLLPEHSYAEFFDPRSEHGTFLARVLEPSDAIRPFFDDLEALFQLQTTEEALAAFETVIKANAVQK